MNQADDVNGILSFLDVFSSARLGTFGKSFPQSGLRAVAFAQRRHGSSVLELIQGMNFFLPPPPLQRGKNIP